jgi:hypothetical protein
MATEGRTAKTSCSPELDEGFREEINAGLLTLIELARMTGSCECR